MVGFMLSFKEYLTGKKAVEPEKQVLDEASLGRLWQHFTKGEPILIISSDRTDKHDQNKANYQSLKNDIHAAKFGYVKVKGGYTETLEDGTRHDVDGENSCVVFGTADTAQRLLKLGMMLGAKYEQECIFWVNNAGVAEWIYTTKTNEHNVGDRVKLGEFHPMQIGQYYTKIGKKKFSFTSIDESVDHIGVHTMEMRLSDYFVKNLDKMEDIADE